MVRGSMKMFLLIVLFMAIPIGAYKHRSVAECDNKSGEVFYDPEEKTCKCDRRRCYSSRNPLDINVKEEDCVHLYIFCGIGMEPDLTETTCFVCKKGTYKSDEGCEWCRPLTVCRETEWIVWPGNATTDTKCSTTKPPEIENTTLQYQNGSLTTSTPSQGADISVDSGIVNDTFVEFGIAKGGMTLSSELLYSFFGICGVTLLAFVFSAMFGCARCRKTPELTTNIGVTEKQTWNMGPEMLIQTCVYQVEGDSQQSGQTQLQDKDETSCKDTISLTTRCNFTESINVDLSGNTSTSHLFFSLLDNSLDMRRKTCCVT